MEIDKFGRPSLPGQRGQTWLTATPVVMLRLVGLKTVHSRLAESETVMRTCSIPRAIHIATARSGNLVRR